MATDVIMPQMGESIAEGTITKWLKKVGDSVTRDEPIFEISTDKVDAEIPSPVAGTLLEIKAQEGQTVPINTVVATIGEAGEKAQAAPEAAAPTPSAERSAPAAAPPAPTPAAPAAAAQAPRPEPPRTAPAAAPAVPVSSAPVPAARPAPSPAPPEGGARIQSIEERIRQRSSPLVRRIAQEQGVDITSIEGTGIYSRVTKNDILSYIENRPAAVATAASGATTAAARAPRPAEAPAVGRAEPAPEAPAPRPAIPLTDRDEIVPMTRIRKITAENMILSKRTSAHVTTVFQIDYTNVARLRDVEQGRLLPEERREADVPAVHLPRVRSGAQGVPAGQRVDRRRQHRATTRT